MDLSKKIASAEHFSVFLLTTSSSTQLLMNFILSYAIESPCQPVAFPSVCFLLFPRGRDTRMTGRVFGGVMALPSTMWSRFFFI